MRSFVTAMGLAFYRGECLFIPKEGTRRLAPLKAATLDPITSLQPKDHLQAFADTCDDAIKDKRRIDEAVALFDYTATLRYDNTTPRNGTGRHLRLCAPVQTHVCRARRRWVAGLVHRSRRQNRRQRIV